MVTPFDETLPTAEDYAWAIEQVKRGRVCRRLDLRFDYQHSGHDRTGEFAHIVFTFALRHRLRVAWLGVMRSMKQMLTAIFFRRPDAPPPSLHYERLKAWAETRFAEIII